MHTIEQNIYSFKELPEEIQDKIIERKSQEISQDPFDFTLEEGMESIKKIASELGFRLLDWSVGAYNRNNYIRVDDPYCTEGHKALAQFLRLLIEKGYSRPKKFSEMEFPGVCGFTGVCFDDDICEAIWESLRDGDNWNVAFSNAAERLGKICEDDLEYRTSREGILEIMDQEEEIYDENGYEI